VFKRDTFMLWVKIAVACIPSAVIGVIADDFLEEHFGSPITVAIMLVVYGIAFIVVEKIRKNKTPNLDSLENITFKTAILIGLFQVLSMIPGTSRSGATIIGALILGVSRTVAAEFTFFMAVPVMLGYSALKLLKFGFSFTSSQLLILAVGCLAAFLTSLLVIRLLMDYVKKHSFSAFGIYRIGLGVIVLIYFFLCR
jgi:undecaprenyl-diphosphatase